MKKIYSTLLFILLLCTGSVWAGDPEDADAAYAKKDFSTALRKFKSAAAQGNASAQSNLGVMYGKGQGVVQDFTRAHMWSNLSAVKGDSDTVKNRDIIAYKMTPQQIAEAQKLARECQARNFKNCD